MFITPRRFLFRFWLGSFCVEFARFVCWSAMDWWPVPDSPILAVPSGIEDEWIMLVSMVICVCVKLYSDIQVSYHLRFPFTPRNAPVKEKSELNPNSDLDWHTLSLFPLFQMPGPREQYDKDGGTPGENTDSIFLLLVFSKQFFYWQMLWVMKRSFWLSLKLLL